MKDHSLQFGIDDYRLAELYDKIDEKITEEFCNVHMEEGNLAESLIESLEISKDNEKAWIRYVVLHMSLMS